MCTSRKGSQRIIPQSGTTVKLKMCQPRRRLGIKQLTACLSRCRDDERCFGIPRSPNAIYIFLLYWCVALRQVPSFNQGKWIAIGDEEGNVSIVDGTAELPEAIAPSEPGARRPTAQWVAHHNAIFDLAWFQVWHMEIE